MDQQQQNTTAMRRPLLVFNCFLLAVGTCGGPLIMRLYFLHGGNRVWLSSFLQTGGCPIIFIPLLISYIHRRRRPRAQYSLNPSEPTNSTEMIFMKPRLFLASSVIGIITGFVDFLYAYGVAQLPVSTSALIRACQLAFTAGFAFWLVKQKFTPYSINAVVLVTAGGAILALHTSGDRRAGEANRDYIAGFLTTVAAAVVYGFILPLVELSYKRARQQITYTLVLEVQFFMSLFATLVCTIAMVINNDFQVIPTEAEAFGLGKAKYYVILVLSAIIWQSFFLGVVGVIFCSSSFFSEIVIAVLLPVTEILAVIIFNEKFQAEKTISLILNLWGFVSYFYGEIKHNKKKMKLELQRRAETTTTQITNF
ncbi:hypothetical protein IC575_029286 [Cucumis melo]|uniref:Probable purine permease n=1 Tax=Cucumis melo TaxID=3656 RepID=A0A9I9CEV3_CUCME